MTLNLQLTVEMTQSQHKKKHTMAWTSPNGRVNKTIKYSVDHILINRRWKLIFQDVRVINEDLKYIVTSVLSVEISNSYILFRKKNQKKRSEDLLEN